MSKEERQALLKNIIENEFNHISQEHEFDDLNKNEEVSKLNHEKIKIFDDLFKNNPELDGKLDNYEQLECSYWTEIARYYFKMGVIAGATNLNFVDKLIL